MLLVCDLIHLAEPMAPAMVARVLRTLACHLTSAAVFWSYLPAGDFYSLSRVINMLLLSTKVLHFHFAVEGYFTTCIATTDEPVLLSVFLVAAVCRHEYQA